MKRALGEPALISKGLAVKLEKEGLLASVNALLERMEAAAGAAVEDGQGLRRCFKSQSRPAKAKAKISRKMDDAAITSP